MKAQTNVSDRFWSKISIGHGPNACWLWKAAATPAGYGLFCESKRPTVQTYAHRFVLRLIGRDPEIAHHTCTNKLCVNPAHLMDMTRRDHARHHAEDRRDPLTGRFA